MPSSPLPLLSPHPSRDPPSSRTWYPYHNSRDFDTNLVMIIIIILISALLASLFLHVTIRCFLRRCRRRSLSTAGKLSQPVPALPTLVFSAGLKLVGDEAVCAICLMEFVDGDGVRVLPRCKHGFHDKCIEGWLGSSSSCPTCRTSCVMSEPEKNRSMTELLPEP